MKYSIGTTYEGGNFNYLKQVIPFVNHIEISPDSLAVNQNGSVHIHPESLRQLKWIENETSCALLVHGVGMSIGSYESMSNDYLYLIDELFQELKTVRWHSEHLAYTMVNGESIGTMLTLPRTDEVAEMICHRVDLIQKKYKAPFLLENVISMLPDAGSTYTEAAFLNKITGLTGCGLILDVYNLECDEANFNFDTASFLQELNLDTVYEMHLAGGATDDEFNFKMDVHSRLIGDSTIELAQNIIDKEPKQLQAITFEILQEFVGSHGTDKIVNELKKLNSIFNSHEPAAITI